MIDLRGQPITSFVNTTLSNQIDCRAGLNLLPSGWEREKKKRFDSLSAEGELPAHSFVILVVGLLLVIPSISVPP